MTQTFQRKPETVQASRVDHLLKLANDDPAKLPKWFQGKCDSGEIIIHKDHISIETEIGLLDAESTDYVVMYTNGEVYPCSEEEFLAEFEEVKEVTA